MKRFSNYLSKVFAILMGILICITISGIIISYPEYGKYFSSTRYCAFCVGIVFIEVITAFLYFGFSKKSSIMINNLFI